MKTIIAVLVLALPSLADDSDLSLAMAMARARAAIVPQKRSQASAVAAWLQQPMHVGTCPCQGTGGCHCVPASECRAGRCADHNPLLGRFPGTQPLQGNDLRPVISENRLASPRNATIQGENMNLLPGNGTFSAAPLPNVNDVQAAAQAAAQFTLPQATGGCPNGRCEAPARVLFPRLRQRP